MLKDWRGRAALGEALFFHMSGGLWASHGSGDYYMRGKNETHYLSSVGA